MESVLLLEDNAHSRCATTAILQLYGYNVTEAATAAQALAIVNKNKRVDVLVTDVGLPDTSGLDLAIQIAEHLPELAILFVSGTTPNTWDSPDKSRYLQLQASKIVDFLEKPFRAPLLWQKVKNLLGRVAQGCKTKSPTV
jgi:CheY-like chemotaxis protein